MRDDVEEFVTDGTCHVIQLAVTEAKPFKVVETVEVGWCLLSIRQPQESCYRYSKLRRPSKLTTGPRAALYLSSV